MLQTYNSFSQLYGYFEANVTLPTAQGSNIGPGISSAFWLLPKNATWPPELDIFESDSSQGNSVDTGLFTNQSGSVQQYYTWTYNLSPGAHTFAVDWEASTTTWYIDGKQVYQTATPSDMHTPMYMLLDNMADAPGHWNGTPNPGTAASMQVNWVHVYTSNPYTGGGSGSSGGSGSGSSGGSGDIPLPAPVTGTGSDTLVLKISEDAYTNGDGTSDAKGDATFTVSVDGHQIGGTFTAQASHGPGQNQTFTFKGDWAPGSHSVAVNFLNDAWNPSAPDSGGSYDRNLYVDGITYDGANTQLGATLAGSGAQTFTLTDTTMVATSSPSPVVTGSGSDALVLSFSEDAFANGDGTSDANGDARFTVSVDGKQLAGIFTAKASHAAGVDQTFTFYGNWAPGNHAVAVNFLNDAWNPSAPDSSGSYDRNLYVDAVTYNGTNTHQSATLAGSGAQNFNMTDNTAVPPAVTGNGSDKLLIKLSEDYYLGNAQFTVAVDGKQLGGTFTATTRHSSGNSQAFSFAGDFGTGQHTVKVTFLNDAYGGSPSLDRNLYVNDIIYNGTDTGDRVGLFSNGSSSFTVSGGTAPSVSEASDHGSLQKNLSQTGTYTVGGDTFVLGGGNAVSATLGTGTSHIAFIGPSSLKITGGSGNASVTADTGTDTFTAGAGSLDVTGGGGKDTFVFHANSGLLTVEDFSVANGDKLVIDSALKASMSQATDGMGGTLITFGAAANHAIDLHGIAAVGSNSITWA
jgi:hypothetical protein